MISVFWICLAHFSLVTIEQRKIYYFSLLKDFVLFICITICHFWKIYIKQILKTCLFLLSLWQTLIKDEHSAWIIKRPCYTKWKIWGFFYFDYMFGCYNLWTFLLDSIHFLHGFLADWLLGLCNKNRWIVILVKMIRYEQTNRQRGHW